MFWSNILEKIKIPDDGFTLNDKIYKPFFKSIHVNFTYEQLKENLNKVQSIPELFSSDFENGADIIKLNHF